jgi:hypothetical protein
VKKTFIDRRIEIRIVMAEELHFGNLVFRHFHGGPVGLERPQG